MRLRVFLFLTAIISISSLSEYCRAGTSEIKISTPPAVYKSENGQFQRIWISLSCEKEPGETKVCLGEFEKTVQLTEGENLFYIDIPEVKSEKKFQLTITGSNAFSASKEIIVNQLNVNEEQITPEASFIDDLGADSLDTVELIMAFEDEFKDQMDGSEIPESDAEKLTTVGKVIEYIEEKSKK